MNPSDKYEQIKDIKHLNPVELEAMVLHHAQQIKDIAAHLLELKQQVTPMMLFKRREWVGLTKEDLQPMFQNVMGYYGFDHKHLKLTNGAGFCVFAKDIEAKLKEKNGG